MKNLALLLALATTTIGFAQNNNDKIPVEPIEQSVFSIGVKGGFGHSFIVPYSNYDFMPSWNAGISAVYAPKQHWGIGLDVTYSGEGVKLKSGDYTNTTQLDYLRVPIKAIYFFRTYEEDFRPKISLAPTLGFMVNDHDNNGFKSTDFGGSLSLGFNYRLLRAVWLNVDASYYQGVIDIYQGNNENDLNGNVRLDLGVSFGF